MPRHGRVKLFGTDGVRGLANDELTPQLAMDVASAAAQVLVAHDASHRPVAVVGRDPRASGEMLEAAVVAGLTSAGADVLLLGVLPTPAVAFLTASYGADVGVVLSASHNPMPDNGIKLFAAGGHKLPDDLEREIETAVQDGPDVRPIGAAIGRVRAADDALERYGGAPARRPADPAGRPACRGRLRERGCVLRRPRDLSRCRGSRDADRGPHPTG